MRIEETVPANNGLISNQTKVFGFLECELRLQSLHSGFEP